jgi:hypothetical protein
VGAADAQELLGPRGTVVEALAHAEGHHVVVEAVDEELGYAHGADFLHVVVADAGDVAHREPRIEPRPQLGNRGEARLDDERARLHVGGQVDGHRAAERTPEEDDVPGLDALLPGEPGPRGVGVLVGPALVRAPGAPPVAAVVEDEHREPQAGELPDRLQAVGNVAGVAVAVEERVAGVGVRRRRDHPAVECAAGNGAEGDVAEFQADAPGVAGVVAAGEIDHAGLGEVRDQAHQCVGGDEYDQDHLHGVTVGRVII